MAEFDLSLSDALTDGIPQSGSESLVQQDFVAQLEAESFDDHVGETVVKMDYIPLLDNDDTRADLDTMLENGEPESNAVQKPGTVGSFGPAQAVYLPSDLQFTSDVSTLISCHPSNLAVSLDDQIDSQPDHERTAYPGGDEREGEGLDQNQKKKKKRQQEIEESFETLGSHGHFEIQAQGEKISSTEDIFNRTGPSRDGEADWEEQLGKCGGRGKRGKSRKKIPEEWGITSEPLVPKSAAASQTKKELMDLGSSAESSFAYINQNSCNQEVYVEEGLVPKPLSKDLFSVPSISPLVLNSVLNATATPFTMPATSNSVTFDSIPVTSYPDDSFDLLMDMENSGLDQCNVSQEREVKVDYMVDSGIFDNTRFAQESCAQGIPEQDTFSPASRSSLGHSPEVLDSAPPISPSDALWVLNDSQMGSSTESFDFSNMKTHDHPLLLGLSFDTPSPAPLRSPKTAAQEFDLKDEKNNKRKCNSSSSSTVKSSSSPGENVTQQAPQVINPSSQLYPSMVFLGSGLNPSAKPFFPSSANSMEEGTAVQPVDSAVEDMMESSAIKKDKLEVEMKNQTQEFNSVKVEFASCETLANEEEEMEKTWPQLEKETEKEIEAEFVRGEEREKVSEKVPEKQAFIVKEDKCGKLIHEKQDIEAETVSKKEVEKPECLADEEIGKKVDDADDMETETIKDKEAKVVEEKENKTFKEIVTDTVNDKESEIVKQMETFKESEIVTENFKDMEEEIVGKKEQATIKDKEAGIDKERESETVKEVKKIEEIMKEMVIEGEIMKGNEKEMVKRGEILTEKETETVKDKKAGTVKKLAAKEKSSEKVTSTNQFDKDADNKKEEAGADKSKDKEPERLDEKKETENKIEADKVESMTAETEDNLSKPEVSTDKDTEAKVDIKMEKTETVTSNNEKTEYISTAKSEETEVKKDAERHVKTPEKWLSPDIPNADMPDIKADVETIMTAVVGGSKSTEADTEGIKAPVKNTQKSGLVGSAVDKNAAEKKGSKKDKAAKPETGDKIKKIKSANDGSNAAPSKGLGSADKKTKPAATKLKAVSKPQHSNAAAGSPVSGSSRLPTISSSTTSDRKMASTKAAPPAAPSPKRPTSTAPSGTTFSAMTYSRDLRPKPSTEMRVTLSKTGAATSTQTAASTKTRTASAAAAKPNSSMRTMLSARSSATAKKTLASTTDNKVGEEKKPSTLRTSTATKPKTTTTTTMARSSATGTTTNCLRGTAAKLATPSSTPENKPAGLHSTRTASLTTTTYKNKTQSGPATVPDTRNAYSKIGSMDIECSVKHQPRGGKLQILNKKLDLSKVTSKCGSRDNIKHKPGGGNVKIESQKGSFKEKSQSKVGSVDNVSHSPGGGSIKAEGVHDIIEGNGTPPGDIMAPVSGSEPVNAGSPTAHTNGLNDGTPCNNQGITEPPALDSHIPETSI